MVSDYYNSPRNDGGMPNSKGFLEFINDNLSSPLNFYINNPFPTSEKHDRFANYEPYIPYKMAQQNVNNYPFQNSSNNPFSGLNNNANNINPLNSMNLETQSTTPQNGYFQNQKMRDFYQNNYNDNQTSHSSNTYNTYDNQKQIDNNDYKVKEEENNQDYRNTNVPQNNKFKLPKLDIDMINYSNKILSETNPTDIFFNNLNSSTPAESNLFWQNLFSNTNLKLYPTSNANKSDGVAYSNINFNNIPGDPKADSTEVKEEFHVIKPRTVLSNIASPIKNENFTYINNSNKDANNVSGKKDSIGGSGVKERVFDETTPVNPNHICSLVSPKSAFNIESNK